MVNSGSGVPSRRPVPQPTIQDDLQIKGDGFHTSSTSPQVNSALQAQSPASARSSSLNPAPINNMMQYLDPQSSGKDRGSSRSRSNSAQRLPGVKDAPVIRKILSLDGGGVRGLSTIIILKHIMKILNKKRGFEVHPWQEFDMIGGTSTGGYLFNPPN